MDPYKDLERWQRLSASAMDLWDQCPRQFHALRVLKLDDPPGIPAEIGHFGHEILEELMAGEPEQRTIGAARDIAARFWPEYAASEPFKALCLDKYGVAAFKAAVWRGIEGFFALGDPTKVNLASPTGPKGPLEAREMDVAAQIGGAWVVGKIDRLDSTALGNQIVDYKFGKSPDKRYLAPKLRQLRLYAAMLIRMGQPEPRRGTLLYVTAQDRVTEMFTPDKIEAVETDVERIWGEVQAAHTADEWTPKPGPLCGWCSRVAECEEGTAEVHIRHAEGRLKPSAPARVALGIIG
jgi:putative RecB family exonuclease